MGKILIFLWLTAPLAWAGKDKQGPTTKKTSSKTNEIEIISTSQKHSRFENMSNEKSEEENSDEKDYTGEYEITPDPKETKESAKDAWHKAQKVTQKEIYEEIMKDLPEILNEKIEEKLRTWSNPLKREEENPGFFKRLTQKIWGKDPSVMADDAMYAYKTKVPEEKKQESAQPDGSKSLIKRVASEGKYPIKKVLLSSGLVAVGYFARDLQDGLFPKDTGGDDPEALTHQINTRGDNPEALTHQINTGGDDLEALTHQMNNCTLNATTNSTETSWFGGQFGSPLDQMTKLLEKSWSSLWGGSEEAQKEISSNINHLPETAYLTQKGLSSKTEKEL